MAVRVHPQVSPGKQSASRRDFVRLAPAAEDTYPFFRHHNLGHEMQLVTAEGNKAVVKH